MKTSLDRQTFKRNKAHLNAAFRDLRKQGILAKQNFTCCQSCGVAELTDEAMVLAQQGRKIKGGVFYDMGDADNLRTDGDCDLTFRGFDFREGATDAALDEASVIVGQIAVATLRRHGVKTEWDGTADKRINIDFTCEGVDQPS